MALKDIIRSAVATAHKITSDGGLQETVELYRWNGQDDTGAPTFASRIEVEALVEHKNRRIRNTTGDEKTRAETRLTFLRPIPALSPAVEGRTEPIDERDKIVLANGETGPIRLADGGLEDQATGRGFVTQVVMD